MESAPRSGSGTPGQVVALVFTDVEQSSRLWQWSPEATRLALEVHDEVLRRVASAQGGYEIRTEGDSFKLAFTSPAAAVRFCTEAQRALVDAPWPAALLTDERCAEVLEHGQVAWRGLRVRMGAHFGVAEPRPHPVTGRIDWYGSTVNATARIAEAPSGGQVVASALLWDTARREDPGLDAVVQDHGEHRLRGVDLPEHLVQIAPAALAGRTFPPLRTESAARVRIPPSQDAFVGREGAVGAIDTLLQDARLVTLHGPGGTGKTRLALEFARRRGYAWAGGAWFVDLAEARRAADAAAGVLAALRGTGEGVTAAGTVLARLGHALVVLDNLEQLGPDGVQAIGSWLQAAPEVRLLVTSRHPLGLPAERRYTVDGLDPAAAVALFQERAALVGAAPGDAAAIARLVEHLDRLPLAIELAAARAEILPPAEIDRRLDRRFKLLARPTGTGPARHATLRAAIAWSWDLLDDAERAAAAQCAVFAGGFTVEAAEAVVVLPDDAPWVVDVLQGLLRKSILRQLPDRRLGMSESIRAYAQEHLEAGDAVRERHARWFLDAGLRWAAGVYTRDDLEAYRSLRAESDNLVAAHDHLRTRDPLAAARLVDVMGPEMLPIVNEGPVDLPGDFAARLSEALAASSGDLVLHARLLRQQAERWRLSLDSAAAFGGFRHALEVAVASGDRMTEAMVMRDLAFGIQYGIVQPAEAEALAREAVRLFEVAGAPLQAAMALFGVALVVRLRDMAAFHTTRREVNARVRANGGPARNAQRGVSGAISGVLSAEYEEAWSEFATGFDTFGRLGLRIDGFVMLFGACAAASIARIDDAERLLAEVRDRGVIDPQHQGMIEGAEAFVALARCIRAREQDDPAAEACLGDVRARIRSIRAAGPDGTPSIEARRPIVRSLVESLYTRAGQAGIDLG